MENYTVDFRKDIEEFKNVTKQFYDGKLSVTEYKNFSGGFGSYAQRGQKLGMLRLRLTGGRITKDNLRFIAESIEKYKIDKIHLTTCQTVQFHNLKADTICSLIEEAFDHGIITRGGGGNFPRNVMMSPLSGVDPNEPFDLTPYAQAAADYLLSLINMVKLPRKLKVCFSNSIKNFPHATFRDLGFVAKENQTFDVYSAGGLGRNPKLGILTAQNAAPEMILYYIKAMVDTFISHGDYKNRAKARTRFMQDTLGQKGYLKVYQEKLEQALLSENLKIQVTPAKISKTGDGAIIHPRILEQKQKGLYSVSYHPVGGCPNPSFFRTIYDAILPMKDVELRLSPDEGMYFINCTASEAKHLISLTKDAAKTLFETSVACIGNHICQLGVRDSQSLLKNCIDAVQPFHFSYGVLPKIHISGCPSSCGTHQTAALGFRGAVKQTPQGPKAAYAVFEGGCDIYGQEHFGDESGVMTEENIPKFLVELGTLIQKENLSYDTWISKNRDKFLKLIQKYCD